MSARASRANRVGVWIITIGFIGGAGYLFATAWSDWRLSRAKEPSVCRVLASRTSVAFGSADDTSVNRDKTPYRAHLRLEHDVGGVRFETEDIEGEYPSMASAGTAADSYEVGQQLPCRYLAGSPGAFTLGRRDPQWRGAVIAGFVALAIVGAAHIDFSALLTRLRRRSS